jgi:hypothetical protein
MCVTLFNTKTKTSNELDGSEDTGIHQPILRDLLKHPGAATPLFAKICCERREAYATEGIAGRGLTQPLMSPLKLEASSNMELISVTLLEYIKQEGKKTQK